MPTYGLKLKRPILGGPYQASDGSLYAYSGMVNFDFTAAASYELIRFTLQKADAKFSIAFNCDWPVLAATGNDTGIEISIDGTSTVRAGFAVGGENPTRNVWTGREWTTDFYVPKHAEVIILVLNPGAGVDLLQANVTLLGHYLDQFSSTGEQVGLTTKPPLLAAMGGLTPTTPKKSISGSQIGGALMEGGW